MPRPGPARPKVTMRVSQTEKDEAQRYRPDNGNESDAYRTVFVAGLAALREKEATR